MELKEYQEQAMTTCMPSSNNFSYMFLNMVGEIGEAASKVAKSLRKGNSIIAANELEHESLYPTEPNAHEAMLKELELELGDVLWQLAGCCSVLGFDLDEVARKNLGKLQARKTAGTIDGNGDGISGKDRHA